MTTGELVRGDGDEDDKAVCVRAYLTALEAEKERKFSLAHAMLTQALKGAPEWLESYAVCYGLTGGQLFRNLSRRLPLYRLPLLFVVWSWFERLANEARWLRLSTNVRLRSHFQLHRGLPVGRIEAFPNPASSPKYPARAAVAIAWRAVLTKAVQIRIGKPDGPLLSRGAPTGRTVTGEWVADGTTLFLQDADNALTLAHTLGVVRVHVRVLAWPPALPSWLSRKRWALEIAWGKLRMRVRARAHLRLERGEAVGYLRVPNNFVRPTTRSMRRSQLRLEWTSAGTQAVEVRLDRPDGKLISRTGTSGVAGIEWAHDGAIAFLQDVSGSLPLTRENTLDVIRIRI